VTKLASQLVARYKTGLVCFSSHLMESAICKLCKLCKLCESPPMVCLWSRSVLCLYSEFRDTHRVVSLQFGPWVLESFESLRRTGATVFFWELILQYQLTSMCSMLIVYYQIQTDSDTRVVVPRCHSHLSGPVSESVNLWWCTHIM